MQRTTIVQMNTEEIKVLVALKIKQARQAVGSHDLDTILSLYNEISVYFLETGDFGQAIEYSKKALATKRKIESSYEESKEFFAMSL